MSEESSRFGVEQTKVGLEIIAMLFSGAAVLCIPLGWVVAHTNFSQYRIQYANLTASSYAWIGALTLASVLFVFLTLLAIKQAASYLWTGFKCLVNKYCFSLETGEPIRGYPRWYLWLGRLQLLAVASFVSYTLIFIGFKIFNLELSGPWKMFLATAFAANLGIILLLYYLNSVKGHLLSRLANIVLLGTLSVGLLSLHAFTFGATLYKDIPVYYWGGRPEPVTLIFKDNAEVKRFLDKEREDFHFVSNLTEPARLLAESKQGYIFLVRDGFDQEKTITIQREMVQELRYMDDSPTLGR
jgi:hypothetical protein